MLTSIRNKSVIVTGGTKGIGKGTAGVFTKLGSRVCVIGRYDDRFDSIVAIGHGGRDWVCGGVLRL